MSYVFQLFRPLRGLWLKPLYIQKRCFPGLRARRFHQIRHDETANKCGPEGEVT